MWSARDAVGGESAGADGGGGASVFESLGSLEMSILPLAGAMARMIPALHGSCMEDGDANAQIQELEQNALAELREVNDAAGLEQYRIKYIGSNGLLKAAMKWLGRVPKE